jgi:hypothetical protein
MGIAEMVPEENGKRDSGLMYYAVGPHGADGGNWMRSQELQIQEGDCGDCWACSGAVYDARARKDGDQYIFDEAGEMFTFSNSSPNGRRCIKSADGEKPSGEWNQSICGASAEVSTWNGVVNMVIHNSGTG